jgi:hypothetical protein
MKIDRSNYEIWIIDWLDGSLSDSLAEELKLFLNENPDIREEFEELSSFRLKPSQETFLQKNVIKKGNSDLSASQFEYLCVAYLEDDLSGEQKTELLQIIENDPERKRSFSLILKTRLTPHNVIFKHKKHLIRQTPFQKIIRLSVIGLSTAAAAALIITLWFLIPRDIPEKTNISSQNNMPDTSVQRPQPQVNVGKKVANNIIAATNRNKVNTFKKEKENIPLNIPPDTLINSEDNSLKTNTRNTEMPVSKIMVRAKINFSRVTEGNKLIALSISQEVTDYDDGRSNVGKFIARTFRDKILREKKVNDTPLKPYEIAEAGITGLNKLLGWEMALNENTDADGNIKSVYFSSRILKFNAPVKKSEPLP